MAGKKYPAVTAGEQYRIGRASVLGWQKKASAISIIGGADVPTSIFNCRKSKLRACIYAYSAADSCHCRLPRCGVVKKADV